MDPFILTRFDKVDVEGDQDPLVSFVIFEWRDVERIGKLRTPEAEEVGPKYRISSDDQY